MKTDSKGIGFDAFPKYDVYNLTLSNTLSNLKMELSGQPKKVVFDNPMNQHFNLLHSLLWTVRLTVVLYICYGTGNYE